MAFLDNSGDIILDAVLTDTGRLRLAQGDGSFKITKFALGDDEINYGNYNKDHASGSAYYDLEILQTPVLEAFTNNTANLNSKLMSIARTNLLYMPTLLLNKRSKTAASQMKGLAQGQPLESLMYDRKDNNDTDEVAPGYQDTRFVVAVDKTTWETMRYQTDTGGSTVGSIQGLIMGFQTGSALGGALIRVDQGLATDQISPTAGLDTDMRESQYILELDYRLGRLVKPDSNASGAVIDVNFIDDDNIASYYVAGGGMVQDNTNTQTETEQKAENSNEVTQVHKGPRGSTMMFRLHASTELQYSTYLFTQVGRTLTAAEAVSELGLSSTTLSAPRGTTVYVIDTTVRVVGANTGFRIDIPVRYVKIEE